MKHFYYFLLCSFIFFGFTYVKDCQTNLEIEEDITIKIAERDQITPEFYKLNLLDQSKVKQIHDDNRSTTAVVPVRISYEKSFFYKKEIKRDTIWYGLKKFHVYDYSCMCNKKL
jgi:hypothetical protein